MVRVRRANTTLTPSDRSVILIAARGGTKLALLPPLGVTSTYVLWWSSFLGALGDLPARKPL
jgi:hypothetical protein